MVVCWLLILALSLTVAIVRTLRGPIAFPLRLLGTAYVDVFRGLPLLLVIFLLLAALSASILPTNKLLVLIAVVTAAVAAVLWRWFIRVHTRMQVALLETLDNHKDMQ